MTTRKQRNEQRRKKYVAFYAPPDLVQAIDTEAKLQERTRSQQLRYLLANALATRPDAAHVPQPNA